MTQRRLSTALAVATMCSALIPAAVAGASTPPSSDAGGQDPYCAAHLALEAATSNDDQSASDAAVEAAKAAAPPVVAAAIDVAVAESPGPEDSFPSPEFNEAYGTIVQYVRDHCGFNELSILAQDYSFGGIGGEVAAGPTVIELDNEGTEYHEIIMFRRNEGVTESVDELMALPDDEVFGKITFAAAATAAPGTIGYGVTDLTPGDYIGLCFIPQGSTPDAVAEMMAESSVPGDSTMTMPAGSEPVGTDGGGEGGFGPPHFMLGMVVEFTVVEGGTTDTGSMVPMDHTSTSMDMTDTTGTTEAA